MKKIFCLLIVFFSQQSLIFAGELDYQAEFGARSYPLGSLLSAQAGYGIEMWRGENPSDEGNFWKYGYVRPAVLLDTAAVVNRAAVELEIFPVSILGLTAGTGFGQRSKNEYEGFDCNLIACDQNLTYHYLRSRLILGYGDAVLIITGRYDFFHQDSGQAFYDEMSYLVAQAGADDLRSLNVLAGYKIKQEWMVGVLTTSQHFIRSRSNNDSILGLLNYSWKNTGGEWRASVGAGTFRSSVQRNDFSAVVSIHWTGAKGLSLF